MDATGLLLAALLFAVATLYTSVGHAGASGYIAMMALVGLAPEEMRPTALALNLLAGGIGLLRFWRGGHVRWRNVLPFVVASAPAAFLAAQVQLPRASYSLLLGLVLVVAALGVFRAARDAEAQDRAAVGRRVPWFPALLVGAGIGVLSGLAGFLLSARLGSAEAVAGSGYELRVIASVVIGGASLFGGLGGIGGTVIGALLIGVLTNGLVVMNVSAYLQQVVIGVIIVAAVAFDTFAKSRRGVIGS